MAVEPEDMDVQVRQHWMHRCASGSWLDTQVSYWLPGEQIIIIDCTYQATAGWTACEVQGLAAM